jgi:hypothetical protein
VLALLIFFLLVISIATIYLESMWRGRRLRETGLLIGYFLISAFFNWFLLGALDSDSGLDPWMCLIGPFITPWPFGIVLAGLLPSFRLPGLRSLLAGIGAITLSFAWLIASELFI